jgi:radical SAM protein with 4Fe4S-binding SPASM domain
MSELGIFGGWLTVNRFCNFRCGWCYAAGTKFKSTDNMPWSMAKNLIDLMYAIGVHNVILIGGETLFWPHLFTAVSYLKSLGMSSTVVTNGWLLGFKKFRDRVQTSDISELSISLKAGNRQQYLELTGFDGFEKVFEGLREVSQWDHMQVETSMVINKPVLSNFEEIADVAFSNGAKALSISMCGPSISNGDFDSRFMPEPMAIVSAVIEKYELLNTLSNGHFSIEGTLPACLWPKDFLEKLEQKGQISYGCHFKTRTGVIFDRWGNIIHCNHLFDYPMGQFGVDFNDVDSFASLWNNLIVNDFYDIMLAYPANACIVCNAFDKCGGGCPLNWFVRDPELVIPKGVST